MFDTLGSVHLELPNAHSMAVQIAQTAAAHMAERGLGFAAAKAAALRELGLDALGPRTALPSNDTVEAALWEHLRLFCPEQPAQLAALRRSAVETMRLLADFSPYLAGGVWHGYATAPTQIYIGTFADDPKAVEVALIETGLNFDVHETPGWHGRLVPALVLSRYNRALNMPEVSNVLLYEANDLRGALKPDAQGRKPRGNLADVRALLAG